MKTAIKFIEVFFLTWLILYLIGAIFITIEQLLGVSHSVLGQ